MIFCTSGTQLPFDRFLKAIDELSPELDGEEIIVQAFPGKYKPKNVKPVQLFSPEEFDIISTEARLIVSHAGMGTILSALEREKPIIIFPRIAALGEHRNDHQMATARKMKEAGYLYSADSIEDLHSLLLRKDLRPLHKLGPTADRSLIEDINTKILSL